jgi:hypothetical protein
LSWWTPLTCGFAICYLIVKFTVLVLIALAIESCSGRR